MTGDSDDHDRGFRPKPEIGHLQSESSVTFGRNDRSRSSGIGGQLGPEYANESVITRSIAAQDEFGLEPQDAVVFASVESGLETYQAEGSRIFITKDRSAFATEQVMEHFRNLQCDVIPAIGPAIGVVKQQPAEVADAIQA